MAMMKQKIAIIKFFISLSIYTFPLRLRWLDNQWGHNVRSMSSPPYGKIVTLKLPLPWVMLKLPAPAVIAFAASVVMVIAELALVAVP